MKKAFPLFLATAALVAAVRAQSVPPAPAALPKPPGLKPLAETPATAIYQAAGDTGTLRAEAAKAFAAAGWEPYGEAGETRSFKKGRLKALVTVSPPAGPDAKPTVSYMVEKMSADLPLPAGAKNVRYAESSKELGFTTTMSPEETAATYGKLLAPSGWATKMSAPQHDELDWTMIYRHAAEGKIELTMRPTEGALVVTARYFTPAEVAAEEARAKKQGDALRAKLAAEAAAPVPEATIPLPKGTTRHFAVKNGLTLELSPGSARAGAEKISKDLQAQGWKAAQPMPLAAETGVIQLTRDDRQITITYMDPGPVPAEMTLAAAGVVLKAKP